MIHSGFNTMDTSATSMSFEPNYAFYVMPKHCGGISKCGKACHKGINCTIVDSYKQGDKTIFKYYCKECKEFGEGATGDCNET